MNDPNLDSLLTRRSLFQASLGTTALLRAAAILPAGVVGYPERTAELKVLDAKTAAVVEAVADALVDDGTPSMPVPSQNGIAERIDGFLAGLHPDVQTQTKLLFTLLEHAPLVFGFFTSRFTRMKRNEQKAYLDGWSDSRFETRRMIGQAFKMFVYVNFYTLPATWSVLGYDGPWVGRFEMPHFEPPLAAYSGPKEPL